MGKTEVLSHRLRMALTCDARGTLVKCDCPMLFIQPKLAAGRKEPFDTEAGGPENDGALNPSRGNRREFDNLRGGGLLLHCARATGSGHKRPALKELLFFSCLFRNPSEHLYSIFNQVSLQPDYVLLWMPKVHAGQ